MQTTCNAFEHDKTRNGGEIFIFSCTFSRKKIHNIFVSVVHEMAKKISSAICDLIQSLKRNTLLALGKLNCWNSAHLSLLPHSAFIFFLPNFLFSSFREIKKPKPVPSPTPPIPQPQRRSGKAKISSFPQPQYLHENDFRSFFLFRSLLEARCSFCLLCKNDLIYHSDNS